ncbi:hypothetical protein ANTQUA_LOCUS3367 [Anthophora quadrimaculata]
MYTDKMKEQSRKEGVEVAKGHESPRHQRNRERKTIRYNPGEEKKGRKGVKERKKEEKKNRQKKRKEVRNDGIRKSCSKRPRG